MPLTDLIRYFNAADNAGNSTLYPAGERVSAWHEGLRLGSLFQPVIDLRHGQVIGHRAQLSTQFEDGLPLSVEQAYARQQTPEAVVHFDRLNRTLHALNFLAQRRYAGGHLQLPVHPRHLQAVQSQHGLVYEAILKRCGLAPEDIVLVIDARNFGHTPHWEDALNNYRQRGYQLALKNLDSQVAMAVLPTLRPDMLQLAADAPAELYETARRLEIVIQHNGIANSHDLKSAQAAGARFGLGELFGLPHPDCRPTHKRDRVAYNSPTPSGSHP